MKAAAPVDPRGRVVARAPNRVDLAGGTLDLDPLYIFEGGAWTVNGAVTVESRTELRRRRDGRVRVRAADSGRTLAADSYDALPDGGPLHLVVHALRHFRPRGGCDLVIANQAPRGTGLGASSALMVTLCAALALAAGKPLGGDALVRLAAELEARVIGVPTGRQDHYAATLGGVNALRFDVGADRVESLDPDGALAAELDRRLILSDPGEPHDSAVSNWQIFRAYVDGDEGTRAALRGIGRAAAGMRRALAAGPDWDAVAGFLREEWRWRRRLAPGVSTPALDRLASVAEAAGAGASKVCGAGGGGCLLTLAQPERRDAVAAALRDAGARLLDARIAAEGLRVEVESEAPSGAGGAAGAGRPSADEPRQHGAEDAEQQ